MVKKVTNKTKNMTGFQLAISLHLPLQTSYGQNFSDSVIGQLSFDTKFMANQSLAYIPQELVLIVSSLKIVRIDPLVIDLLPSMLDYSTVYCSPSY